MDQVLTCLSSSPLATVAVHHFQRIARRKLHIIRTKKIHNLVEIKKRERKLGTFMHLNNGNATNVTLR